jgi:hypothetical protein
MASWAEIDDNNIVLRVLVTDDEDPNNDEGYQWLVDNLGGRWVQTSVTARIRKNCAGIGFVYDEERDAFIPPRPYASWTLNDDTCLWEAPIPAPEDGRFYFWNEEDLMWRSHDE